MENELKLLADTRVVYSKKFTDPTGNNVCLV